MDMREAHNIGNVRVREYEHLCASMYHAIMDLSFIYIAYKVIDKCVIQNMFYNWIYTLYIYYLSLGIGV